MRIILNNNLLFNINMNYDNFDWLFYVKMNSDLSHLTTKKDAFNHYMKKGKNENRIYKQDNNINIDLEFYKFIYDDLSDINDNVELIKHYYLNGKNEDRIINKNDVRYKLFHWKYYLEYNGDIHFNKLTNNKFSMKDYAFKHYISHGIKEKRNVYNFQDFDVDFYKNIYNLNTDSIEEIKIHYLENENIFINKNIYNNYKLFDHNKYKTYYNLETSFSKDYLYNHYLKNYKNGNIYFYYNKLNSTIKSKIGIAVSLYINNDTPYERILCSKICVNSILKECYNMYIIFLIDNCVTIEYLNFLFDAIDNRDNVKVYVNKKNYGIAKTKNICMKLLEELDIEYLCLLDDDVEIKMNFSQYIENIFSNVNNIPLLTNYNFELPYSKINYNNIEFIKTSNYFGNFLIFNKKFINIYGYMRIFDYKWGHEHIDITHRYLNNTIYKDSAIDLTNFINNFQIINFKNTLHLHSCNIDHSKVDINKNILDKYKNNFNYVDYILDKTTIIEITKLEMNKINFINKKLNVYNQNIKKYLKYNNYLKGSYWSKLDSFINKFYSLINKDYNEYNNFSIINKVIDKINNYNITIDIKEKIIEDMKNIKNELFENNCMKDNDINVMKENDINVMKDIVIENKFIIFDKCIIVEKETQLDNICSLPTFFTDKFLELDNVIHNNSIDIALHKETELDNELDNVLDNVLDNNSIDIVLQKETELHNVLDNVFSYITTPENSSLSTDKSSDKFIVLDNVLDNNSIHIALHKETQLDTIHL